MRKKHFKSLIALFSIFICSDFQLIHCYETEYLFSIYVIKLKRLKTIRVKNLLDEIIPFRSINENFISVGMSNLVFIIFIYI